MGDQTDTKEDTTNPLLTNIEKTEFEKPLNDVRKFAKRTYSKVCSKKFLLHRLPILSWIVSYNLEMLLCDTIAGVTTALTVIPQGIGYAPLAGLPLQYGLYGSIVPGFVYCILGTTR